MARIKGIGDVEIFGASEYAMRIWLAPDKVASFGISATEVISALRGQNIQVASGSLNKLPAENQSSFEINVQTQGNFSSKEDLENVIVKSSGEGRIERIKDIGLV